jgi:integrase
MKPSLSQVLSFLTHLYQSGLGYSSINSCRSALSIFLPKYDDCNLGSHPLVMRLLKAVGKERPPKAKYDMTWDVNKLLDYLRQLPDNSDLTLKQLTLKLVSLLAIVTGHRVQTLSFITINNIHFKDNVEILIEKLVKTSAPGKNQPLLILPPYPIDSKVCVVLTLKEYLKVTNLIRNNNQSLLLTLAKPHKPATTQTISRWLKEMLILAKIDSIYGAHSYRHASTSKAEQKGVLIDVIYSRVGWSKNSEVFAKYYKKKIDNKAVFGLNVLS